MPATVSNTRDLFLLSLAELLFVERRLAAEVLPQMLGEVADPDLSSVLAEHLQQTKQHCASVEGAFRAAGAESSCDLSPPFAALSEQHAELSGGAVGAPLADLVHLQASLRVEHFEIAAYRALVEMADAVAPEASSALAAVLSEEQQAQDALQGLLEALVSRTAGLSQESVR